uniref:Signal peptidase complex subunit 1 n=1 Tax=Panagrellus redivivus TaxID=6233 RepID=A0A7E4UVE6_PANRE
MDTVIAMLPPWLQLLDTSIDFKGQQKAEYLYQGIIVLFAAIGFVVGYIYQQTWITFQILFVGVAISSVLVLPAWPCFRRNPVEWKQHTE